MVAVAVDANNDDDDDYNDGAQLQYMYLLQLIFLQYLSLITICYC